MDSVFVKHFAEEWVNAWNSHDLEQIMSHYAEDFEMSSPVIQQIMGIESGTIKGKQQVREYWAKALAKIPELHFELMGYYAGVNSIVLHYKGHRGLSAEVFFFNNYGLVDRAIANYIVD